MRLSRSKLLSSPKGTVHLYWRAHNREFLLGSSEIKRLYFESLKIGLNHRNTDSKVKLHAFCIMSNHHHSQMSYENDSKYLSRFMRVAHSRFGTYFNKIHERTGKVANERPKTPLVGDQESEMRLHFYIEANPIRAGLTILEKLRYYYWNSYRYYAYGEIDDVTSAITPPAWYIALGSTAKARQEKYRKLFRFYLEQSLIQSKWFFARFIGNAEWIMRQEELLKKKIRATEQFTTVPPE